MIALKDTDGLFDVRGSGVANTVAMVRLKEVVNNFHSSIELDQREEVHDGGGLKVLSCTVTENLDGLVIIEPALVDHVEPGLDHKRTVIFHVVPTGHKVVHGRFHLAVFNWIIVLENNNEVLVEGALDLKLGEVLDNHQNIGQSLLNERVLLLLEEVALLVPARPVK